MVQTHKRKYTARAFMSEETHSRVKRYAANLGIDIGAAYGIIINNVIDEKGNTKDRLVLSPAHLDLIDELAGIMELPKDKVLEEMLSAAFLFMGTDVPINMVLVQSAPLLMDRLVNINPEKAKTVLKTLREG